MLNTVRFGVNTFLVECYALYGVISVLNTYYKFIRTRSNYVENEENYNNSADNNGKITNNIS